MVVNVNAFRVFIPFYGVYYSRVEVQLPFLEPGSDLCKDGRIISLNDLKALSQY